ncbi:DNA polymerase delta subunit 4 [Bulinus truncatus]|nr:DNA polymerase delta subunit 4 [Bulinus truncatus]
MSGKRITESFPHKKRTITSSKFPLSENQANQESPTCSSTFTEPKNKKELDILKAFDLTLKFGPCIGITRMERWNRAQKHDLNPPLIVKEIIQKHELEELFTQSLWNDYPTLR